MKYVKKKMILTVFMCIVLCGCTPIQKMSLKEVVNNGTERKVSVYNKYRKGYKYNTPKGLDVLDNTEYNEVIYSSDYIYYLYVDAVSYYNKVIEKYKQNNSSYVSMPIDYEDKYGYLEINELKSGKYLVEIMYNYAKMEVIVKKDDINVVVANAMSILTSIKFNNSVLDTYLSEENSQFREFEFNIFETASTDSQYLQAVEEDIYDEDEIHDSDLID